MKSIKSSWTKVINASTLPLKDTAWSEFKIKYGQVYRPVVDYIEDEWLRYGTARHFLHCYTGHVLHFGNSTTSRAEGAHWILKRDLQMVSKNDLLSCIRSFEQTVKAQHRALKDRLDDARIRQPIKLLIPFYRDVINKVSPHALHKVHAIYEQYLPLHPRNHRKPPIPDGCTGVTTATMGIPCIHVIKQLYDTQQSLNMRDFHRHWHITQELEGEDEHAQEELWNLLEPAVVQGNGQPKGTSNKRKNYPPPLDQAQFEIIEQTSTQVSSTTQRQQGVKRRRIENVRVSSPELQPLEELVTQAMQAERTENSQGQESSELQNIPSEQQKEASNSGKGKKAVQSKGKGEGRRRATDGKVPGVPEHMTGKFQL
jgi:hypothetical protein